VCVVSSGKLTCEFKAAKIATVLSFPKTRSYSIQPQAQRTKRTSPVILLAAVVLLKCSMSTELRQSRKGEGQKERKHSCGLLGKQG
jgi:hypothetical protein